MKSVILAYHSHKIAGDTYATNDHIALASDLRLLHRIGARVESLSSIADAIAVASADDRSIRVGISFDDGPVFDFVDFVHPKYGAQRSFVNIMRDFRSEHGDGALPGLHATSFVIASPEARRAMERSPDSGYEFIGGWLRDDWWQPAVDSGFIELGNHSWDHVHHSAPRPPIESPERGNFAVVETFREADAEIRTASEYIGAHVGQSPALFAYPYGHMNEYLVNDYFPEHGPSLGLKAAFGTGGG